LAKAADSDDLTHTGDIVGTVRYMAPERFEGHCDARSDVYALGLTLYELLALRPAFERSDRAELIRQVTHEEPPRLRGIDPTIPHDLETVVHKAIEREPGRRYGDAAALAADLRRFVEGRPIRARRVSVLEHAWRWCRRNPVVAGLAVAVFLAMALGTAVSTAQAIRARAAERLASRRATALAVANATTSRALAEATAARARTDSALKESEQSRLQAEAVSRFLVEAFRKPDPEQDGSKVMVAEVLGQAESKLEGQFASSPRVAGELLQALGQTYYGLGLYDKAAAVHQRAVLVRQSSLGPDHPQTLASRNELAEADFAAGRKAEALVLFEQTLKLREARLGNDHPDTLTSRNDLGAAYLEMGQTAEAIPLLEQTLRLREAKLGRDHRDTLTSRNELAAAYLRAGRMAEAIQMHEQILKQSEARLGPDHPFTLTTHNDLAVAYTVAGRTAEAIVLYEQTLKLSETKLGPDHPNTLTHRTNLAAAYRAAGRTAEVIDLLEQPLKLMETKLGPDHPATLASRNLLAAAYGAAGRTAEAIALHERTIPLFERALKFREAKLGPDHPDTLTSRKHLANSYQALGRHAEALKLREEALALQQAKLGPDHRETLRTMNDLANSYQALGRCDEALAACCRAITLDPSYHASWNHAATLWAQTGDRAGYRGHRRRMLDRFGRTTDPALAERTAKACLLVPLRGPEQAAACDLADRAVAMARGHGVLPWAEVTRGLAAYRREQFADAVAWADRCLAWDQRSWNRELPAHLVRALALARLGRHAEAGAALARTSDLYRTTVANPAVRAAGGDWHDQVICEVLRREAEALFLDWDFPAHPFAP
jgi:tetratricopeptide (TPR) repeat protein